MNREQDVQEGGMTARFRPAEGPIDVTHLRAWVGRVQVQSDVASLRHARLMAATLGQAGVSLQDGDPLPPLWHWLYFLEGQVPGELGPDGHPARGGFLPPVPLPNRMWAGGRLEFFEPIRLGAAFEQHAQVLRVEHKQGRSGELVFVTVLREVMVQGRRCLREEHDIVYKQAGEPGVAPAAGPQGLQPLMAEPGDRQIVPDATLLFRYSALTFNGHRIHYDQAYCRRVEGYPDLVIHGPLIATLLAGHGEAAAGRPLRRFSYRALRPAILGRTLTLRARAQDGGAIGLVCLLDDGAVAMSAEAEV